MLLNLYYMLCIYIEKKERDTLLVDRIDLFEIPIYHISIINL
jgi:hypothetical protein